jgi:hypothetical protein
MSLRRGAGLNLITGPTRILFWTASRMRRSLVCRGLSTELSRLYYHFAPK